MKDITAWLKNRENLKTLFMLALAVVFLFVLKHRFSSQKAPAESVSSAVVYEDKKPEDNLLSGYRDDDNPRVHVSEVQGNESKKAPGDLNRDIFSFPGADSESEKKTAQVVLPSVLDATILDEKGSVAIIDNEVFRVGESVNGLRVAAIRTGEVVLSDGAGDYTLRVVKE